MRHFKDPGAGVCFACVQSCQNSVKELFEKEEAFIYFNYFNTGPDNNDEEKKIIGHSIIEAATLAGLEVKEWTGNTEDAIAVKFTKESLFSKGDRGDAMKVLANIVYQDIQDIWSSNVIGKGQPKYLKYKHISLPHITMKNN
jgi:hypothetical protein